MKIFYALLFALIIFFYPFNVNAQGLEDSYVIKNFTSEITLENDTSLNVKETIVVNFPDPRHGIYRIIPVVYSARGKTIRAGLDILDIKDSQGSPYVYEQSRQGASVSLKIGDPDITLKGETTYVINYRISKVLQQFKDYDEIYWNVTGREWDTEILESRVSLKTPYANIVKTECFAGSFGGSDRFCTVSPDQNTANFASTTSLGPGKDFTIVVGIDKKNDLTYPGFMLQSFWLVRDNWGYLISFVPFLVISYLWYKKGRDRRFLSENIYYEPDDKSSRTVSLFERPHLPFVYHPIAKLTPGEVGTIVDEKVDITDVIAEILELARLKFISIRKIETKKLFGTNTEYAFIKDKNFSDDKELLKLKDYQKYLLEELFRSTVVHKSVELAEKLFKGKSENLSEVRQLLIKKEYILLSALKNHFYEGLPVLKEKLYKRMEDEKIFEGNPEKVRNNWLGGYIALLVASGLLILKFTESTSNFVPIFPFIFLAVPGFIFSWSMPRRSPKGYSYFRQIKGLSWYLEKGKWRHEVAEKHLFIEEILPLAVSLGVVNKIAKDMADLGIKPPSYFAGTSIGSFSRDLAAFNIASTTNMLSAPGGKFSGSSSWSGGSGFSGGSSGGGFGGGGGGSW